MAYLRYLDTANQIQTRVLDAGQFVIGRAPTCQLAFESDMLSREHLRIDLEGDGRYRVRDLGSRNKTYVNGELIRETLLTHGAIIRAGDQLIEFLEDSVAPGGKLDMEFLTPDRTEPADCEWHKTKAPISLTRLQVEQLARLSGDQPLTARAEDIADMALGQILLDVQAERGLIALRGERKTELRPIAHRGLSRGPAGSLTPVSQSFALAPLLQHVAGRYPQTSGKIDKKSGYADAAMVSPLTFNGDAVGVLYVDRPSAKKPFAGAALPYCAAAGAQIGALLGEAQRKLSSFAAREGATWMSVIRRLQKSLARPVVATDAFDVASTCFAGRLRCGDLGLVVHLDEQRCAMLLIDGGGHGVSGLAQSASIQAAVETALGVSEDAVIDPALVFQALNRHLATSAARQVIPVTLIGIDMNAGKVSYVNAGGKPPLLMVAPGRLVTLDEMSLVLGVDGEYLYQTTRVDLPEVFRVLGHTDGLTEAASAAGETFGDQRFHETLLERDAFAGVSEVLSAVARTWSAHMAGAQPEDDALVLVVGRG